MAKHKTGDVIAMMATIQKYWTTASGEPELKEFATFMLDMMDARVGEAAMSKALNGSGLEFTVDNAGEMIITPSHLRLDNIKVELVKRGRYIADPALVPPELQDKNILWIDEPPVVSATTINGDEIPVYVQTVTTNYREVHPDDDGR
jgi:hypothetical protein